MKMQRTQSGATLIVSLIMLLVLTLLVVSAIRSGNTNLRISGNMQVQTEASAAAQQAIEEVIGTDFTSVPAAQNIPVTAGAVSYTVMVATPVCNNTVPIPSTDPSLNPKDADDLLCFGEEAPPPVLDHTGKPIATLTKCNNQQWEVQADVSDANSGARTAQYQGIAKRTYLPTAC